MNYTKKEVKKGIAVHNIVTDKFKTNLYAVFLAIPLSKEDVTKNALITAVLRRGTENIKTQEEISKKLEEMYGASFDCGVEKTGDNQVLKFYLEALNEKFLPEKEELTKRCIEILFDIILNPLVENNGFKTEYVEGEKQKIKEIIESKIDNKRAYAFERCIEEMFKNAPYGIYKYGYVEDLEKITPQDLYTHYKKLISECKMDIFVSGEIDNRINEIIEGNAEIQKLNDRDAKYCTNKEISANKEKKQEKIVEEHMQVEQGNLVIGLDINCQKPNEKYIASVYNAILGGGANSKLFQNVREKNSLAYTAGSTFRRQKNVIFIRCGIEIDKYEKALSTIKEQITDMADGNFTEEDINNSKNLIISSIKSISAEQDAEITYYYGQELSDKFNTLDEYIKNIEAVTREDITELAKEIWIDTIYFLCRFGDRSKSDIDNTRSLIKTRTV